MDESEAVKLERIREAAPDLLQACKLAYDLCCECGYDPKHIMTISALLDAIEKAEGF